MVQELLCKIQMSKRHSSKFESSEDHPHESSQIINIGVRFKSSEDHPHGSSQDN